MKQNRKRKETAGMNFLRYLGPGLLSRSVLSTGKLGIQHCRRIGLRLRASVDGYPVHDHADFLQHNAAHLGIATGKCLSEAASLYLPAWLKNHDSCDGDDGSGGDRNGGDPRRCDCAPDAVRHSD